MYTVSIKKWFGSIKNCLKAQEKATATLSHILCIVVVVVAILQLIEYKKNNGRLLAIDAIKTIRCPEFLKSYTRLQTISEAIRHKASLSKVLQEIYREGEEGVNTNRMIDDLNLVFTSFATCWDYYREGLADREILFHAIISEVRMFSIVLHPIEEQVRFPINKREFDKMLVEFLQKDWSTEKRGRHPMPEYE